MDRPVSDSQDRPTGAMADAPDFLDMIENDVAAAPARKCGRKPKGYTGRLRKIECPAPGCGFIAQVSRGALVRCGFPTCGCGERMQLAHMRDRAVVEYDALAEELESFGLVDKDRPELGTVFDRAMRELGYTDLVAPSKRDRKSGGDQHRCAYAGCHRWTAAEFCREHETYRPELGRARKGLG